MATERVNLFDVDPARVAALIEGATEHERIWSDTEMASVLAHQLGAPVQFNLSQLDHTLAAQLRAVADSEDLLLTSFGDLLRHAAPPVDLLVLTKEFAKRCRLGSGSALPDDVASVLYYAAIAAALVRCNRRISALTDPDLRQGVKWSLGRKWLDASTRELLLHAWQCLNENQEPTV